MRANGRADRRPLDPPPLRGRRESSDGASISGTPSDWLYAGGASTPRRASGRRGSANHDEGWLSPSPTKSRSPTPVDIRKLALEQLRADAAEAQRGAGRRISPSAHLHSPGAL